MSKWLEFPGFRGLSDWLLTPNGLRFFWWFVKRNWSNLKKTQEGELLSRRQVAKDDVIVIELCPCDTGVIAVEVFSSVWIKIHVVNRLDGTRFSGKRRTVFNRLDRERLWYSLPEKAKSVYGQSHPIAIATFENETVVDLAERLDKRDWFKFCDRVKEITDRHKAGGTERVDSSVH